DSCLPLGSSAPSNASMNTLLPDSQVSLIHARGLPDHSVSKHLAPTIVALSRYPSALPLPVFRVRFRHRAVGSSGLPGRIEFVILRTGRSPPAASHPASWRRSCIQLQAGERMPEEDLHLSDLACSQAHSPGVHAWVHGTGSLILSPIYGALTISPHGSERPLKRSQSLLKGGFSSPGVHAW